MLTTYRIYAIMCVPVMVLLVSVAGMASRDRLDRGKSQS
jgi:hypothetical protein